MESQFRNAESQRQVPGCTAAVRLLVQTSRLLPERLLLHGSLGLPGAVTPAREVAVVASHLCGSHVEHQFVGDIIGRCPVCLSL